jgi:multidrug efflux pump subunit AcrA (membrane-fusion protein)
MRRTNIRRSVLESTCVLASSLAIAACSQSPGALPSGAQGVSAAPRETVDVAVATGELASVQRHVRATGTLFGEEQTLIAAKVAGRVEAVFHDMGDELKPGEPLLRIEGVDYELALAERRRAFEQALARLGLEALPKSEAFSVDSLPAVERARLQAENAKARFERGQTLHKRTPPAMSDQDFADIETAWEVAQADHQVARLNAKAQLAEARALEAQVATAAQRLADTTHVVPRGQRPGSGAEEGAIDTGYEYVVTARRVSTGDYVLVGAPMFELVDPDPLKLRVRVPEREVAHVRLGAKAQLWVDAYKTPFEGSVARINPSVEARTRTFEVEIAVPNGDRRLRAGSFAKVAIESEVESEVLLIPRTALTVFAGVHKVFVVEDGKALERVVTLGQEVDERVEIVKGLGPKETIVPAPPAGLSSGTPVRAVPAKPGGGQ